MTLERYAPALAGVALAVPTLVAYYPPMTDLPLHEGLVGILRHLHDPSYFPKSLYELNLGHPNQLFHVLSWGLSYVVGTRWAVKLVVAGAQISTMITGARLADHLGRSRWAALLLAPLALGFTFFWGLVTNLLGFAVLFGALPVIDRAAARPTVRGAIEVAAVFAVLFYAHESVAVLGIAVAAMFAVLHRPAPRETALRLAPVAFGLAGVMAHYFLSRRVFTRIQLRVKDTFPPLSERVLNVPNDLFGSHDLPARLALFALAVGCAIALAAARVRSREQRPSARGGTVRRGMDLLLHYRFEATAIAFLVGYALAPSAWNSNNLLYSRLAGPAWALFAITAAPRQGPSRLVKSAIAVVPLAVLFVAWPQFADSHRAYRDLGSVFELIPRGSSVLFCNVDRPLVRTRVFGVSVGPARVLAERGGRASMSLVTSPIAPARMSPEYRWNEFDERTESLAPRFLLPTYDLSRFGFAIAHSRDPVLLEVVAAALRPDADVVAIRGEWMLLRSTHETVPLDRPDSAPRAGLETLADRMNVVLAKLRTEPSPEQP
jgi:hypothetical protein